MRIDRWILPARRFLLILLLAAPGMVAADGLPELGDANAAILTPAQERKLGENAMLDLRASGAYLNDPEVNAYLNELGNRLVAVLPGGSKDFEFFAVNDFSVNAFALPGGFVGVNAGLLVLVQNESELASVLAHEISHVTQHHIARLMESQQKAGLLSLAGMAAAIIAARSNPQAAQGIAMASQAGFIQSQLNFTRENEQEADRIGFALLDAAHFDTSAMASFMERLQRATRVQDNGKTPSYLRTHPITSERIAEAQDRAQGKSYRQVPDSSDFHFVRALVRSYQGDEREAITYFETALAEKKFNNEAAARYGLAAALLRAKNYARATREVAVLERMAPKQAMVEALACQILLQEGQLKPAIARFEAALKRFPSHMQLIYDYPEALLRDGQAKPAVQFLEDELQRFPHDGHLHQLAARAYAGLDRRALEHWHQGEFYAWQGNLKGAVEQLELALNSRDGDFYQLSVIGARLRTLRDDLEEQKKAARSGA